eukprot:scaffold7386_cov71-Phaeocystis_antarctica.AAC.4
MVSDQIRAAVAVRGTGLIVHTPASSHPRGSAHPQGLGAALAVAAEVDSLGAALARPCGAGPEPPQHRHALLT